MRACRYTASPLTSSGSVVCQQPTRGEYHKKKERAMEFEVFHNPIGAFRRKAAYINENVEKLK
jgi:hypothetical protein